MFTPQEVSEKTFPKASGFNNGYGMAAVDEFLDALTEDYTALYKDNAALKAKLKVLAEKVEEYRATEDAMRSTLLTAQKMADDMVKEAEATKASLIHQAEEEARQEEQRKEERRRSNIFWLLFSGNILVRKGASEYYRYMICIAAMFFVSIFVMFTALHLDMKYSRLYREVQMLRERSTRLQEQRFRHTTHSAILEELRRRGIDLYDPVVPGEILDD